MSIHTLALRSLALACLSLSGSLAGTRAQEQTNLDPPHDRDWIVAACDDDSLIVAHVSPNDVDVKRLGIRLRSLFPNARTMITDLLTRADRLKADLAEQAISEFAIVVSTHAGPSFSPLICVPTELGTRDGTLDEATLKQLVSDHFDAAYSLRRIGTTWVAGTEQGIASLVDNLERQRPQDQLVRQQVLERLTANRVACGLQVLARLSNDHRAAISQRQIELPAWLGSGNPSEFAEAVECLRLRVTADEQVAIDLWAEPRAGSDASRLSTLETRSELDATSESDAIAKTRQLIGQQLISMLADMDVSEPAATALVDDSFTADPTQVVVQLSSDGPNFRQFTQSVVPEMNGLFAERAKAHASLQMRKIWLQIHNHESAYKFLPGGMDRGEAYNGRLSWRVHILPFLGDAEAELFKRFRLDEDWDSEHNKQLIPLMPAIFIMPNSALLPSQGLSNICVPTGPDTMWPLDRVLKFEDITDRDTLAVFEVQDKYAQVWTKPELFEVDPNDLASKLGGHFAGEFLMLTIDGRAMPIFRSLDMEPEQFARMLTRAAGD